MTAKYTIRKYQSQDEAKLKQFIGQLHDHVVSTDPISRLRHLPGLIDYKYNKLITNITDQDGIIYMAETNGEVVGFSACFVSSKQTQDNLLEVIPTQLGIISDLFIAKTHRHKGIGKHLLQEAETYLQAKGCDSIWITVFAPNQSAWDFYNSNGYSNREVGMLKNLNKN